MCGTPVIIYMCSHTYMTGIGVNEHPIIFMKLKFNYQKIIASISYFEGFIKYLKGFDQRLVYKKERITYLTQITQ